MSDLIFILAMLGVVLTVLLILIDKLAKERNAKRLARELKTYYRDRPWMRW